MKILAFTSSVRKDSLNRKLITLAAKAARAFGVEVDLVDFREFDMPLYDGDLEVASGLPAGARSLGEKIKNADGIIISTPTYNFSLPGNLKNAIDWVSRIRPVPIDDKPVLLLAASPSMSGGLLGAYETRNVLLSLGAFVYPDVFTLAKAHEAFDAENALKDPALGSRLTQLVTGFIGFIHRMKTEVPAK